MTLRQLLTFATVARLGSVQASARELGISEPAVSAAVGALRREFGDDLYQREGGALVLTRAGRHLASLAAEITDLADRARHAVGAEGLPRRELHVAVSMDVEEHVVAPLLAAFTDREPELDIAVAVEPPEAFGELLLHRRADVTLGPRPGTAPGRPVVAVPFLRYQLVVVAARGDPITETPAVPARKLEHRPWCVGPGSVDDGTAIAAFLAASNIAPDDVRAFPSDAAALSAVAAGEGVMLTLAHAAQPGLQRGALARVDVAGTPVQGRWFVATLDEAASLTAALALRRFAASADAVQAIAATRRQGVPAAKVRPAVHATLWSAVARR